MSAVFHIENAILCDSVRTEDNAKQILIGVYTGDVLLQKAPAVLQLWFWVQLRIEVGILNFEMLLQMPDGQKYSHPSVQCEASEPNTLVTFVTGLPPKPISQSGEIALKIRETGKKRWKVIAAKRVLLAEGVIDPTASEQPSSRSRRASRKKAS